MLVSAQHAVRLRVGETHRARSVASDTQRRLGVTAPSRAHRGMAVDGDYAALVPVVSTRYTAHTPQLVRLEGVHQLVRLQLPQLHRVVQRHRDEQLARGIHRGAANRVRVAAQHLLVMIPHVSHGKLNTLRQTPTPHAVVISRRKNHVALRFRQEGGIHLVVPAEQLGLLGALQRLNQLSILRVPHLDHSIHVARSQEFSGCIERKITDAILVPGERNAGNGRRNVVRELENERLIVLTSRCQLKRMALVESDTQHRIRMTREGLHHHARRETQNTNRVALDFALTEKSRILHRVVNAVLFLVHSLVLVSH